MEIIDLREINKGCLKFAFRLKLELTDKTGRKVNSTTECAYFEKDNGSFWINVAPKEYVTADGRKKTYNMHTWDEETVKLISNGVREKLKAGDFKKHVSKNAPVPSFDDSECPF